MFDTKKTSQESLTKSSLRIFYCKAFMDKVTEMNWLVYEIHPCGINNGCEPFSYSSSLTEANPDVYASMPSFKINAPQNTTYPSNPMVFKVEAGMVKGEYTGETKPTLFCLIDNKPITNKAQILSETPSYIRFSGETSLNLTIGNHTFSVQDTLLTNRYNVSSISSI